METRVGRNSKLPSCTTAPLSSGFGAESAERPLVGPYITITTRLVDTVSAAMLLNTVRSHKIDPKLLITDVLRQRKSGRGDFADLSKGVSSRIALDPRRSSSYDGAGPARDQD
jgi:hypothetical protein